MKLIGCQEIVSTWIPYGEENSGKKMVKRFHSESGNTLELVGYFPWVP
jgi:hypothetical protein